jgi:two-component system NtrC family sensor kinase
MRRRAKLGKAKVKAKRPRVRKSPKHEESRVRDLEKRLTEAVKQQTATADILGVISRSSTDVQPVFDTIAMSAVSLCDGAFGSVFRFDGELVTLGAQYDTLEEQERTAWRSLFPMRPDHGTVFGKAILTRSVVHVADIGEDRRFPEIQRAYGYRSALVVPMLREGVVIGAIGLFRQEPKPFSDSQVLLLQTFANQAVIAIENVRLFTELEARNAEQTDTLARQMATGEVLRAISRAQTDAQPVFDIIATSARRLCGANYGQVQLYDGELIRLAALDNVDPEGAEAIRRAYPLRVGDGNLGGRVIGRRAVVQIPDLLEDGAYQYKSTWEASGLRSLLGVPMLRGGEPIGAIAVGRPETGLFLEKQVELLQTFADQAVIAIENVRLFKELEGRNRDLTATSEILQVISRSPTDIQPVLETVAANALRLCDAKFSLICRFDGELIHLAALHNLAPEGATAIRNAFPMPPGRGSASARAILTRSIVHIPDVREDPEYVLRDVAQTVEHRNALSVPLLRDGDPIGVITVGGGHGKAIL